MNLTITGYSTALFSTWYFIEEPGILFDAGDGVASSLLQKARKIDHVFISHADRDHLAGLLQFNQLNAREGFPVLHYPRHCGSFPAMEEFTKKFDPHVKGTVWKPVEDEDEIKISDSLSVKAIRNNHVKADLSIHKSLSYKIYQTKSKLKPEFAAIPQNHIRELVAQHGKEQLSYEIKTNILTYSGDTPVDDYEKWNNSKILIHEATFLGGEEDGVISKHGNRHSTLDEVLKMVSEINIETLILGHFSSRYSNEQIDARIRSLCKEYSVKIPVYRVLPGIVHRNILKEEPVNG
jgi:ribonuclease Z